MRNASLLIAICCCLSAASDQSSVVGVVDTIGGTTYDWQMSGPAWRMLVNAPGHGIHAVWMYSAEMSSTYFPDRNMRYNYHDYATHTWNWIDADFMLSGGSIFPMRTGYGNVDVDTNGVAVVSAHHSTGSGYADIAPIVARDADAGAGIFDYAPGEPTIDHYEWPCIGVGMNGYYHLAMIGANSQDSLYWSRSTDQGWDSAMSIPPPEPEPLFPDHNIATSKVSGSNKVCITWVATSVSGYMQQPGFYRESQDGGDIWDAPVDLGFPPAYSGDTAPSYHIASLFPFYDGHDRLHLVGCVHPYVRDTNWLAPSEIWHYSPDNAPQWTRIHRAGVFNPLDSNPTFACRPSIGEDQGGGLYVAWEQFDSANIEPGPPARARADIFYAQDNGDNGASWQPGAIITDQDTWTCRFPSAIDHFADDTFRILYMIDQHAGSFLYGEGPATNNPVVVHKVPVTPSFVTDKEQMVTGIDLSVSPSPFARKTTTRLELPREQSVEVAVYNSVGQRVRSLASGLRQAGAHSLAWDGTDERGRNVRAGIYYLRVKTERGALVQPVVLLR